jgi:hypothetical protein
MNIVRGIKHPPARIVIFGPSGVGKSTFACGADSVLALDYEHGLDEIGPARVEGATTWEGSLSLVREACVGAGEHTTVVVDTLDRLEDQATEHVCRVGVKGKPMADLGAFGYGDGYEALCAKWRELLFVLESARPKGREVILVAHVQNKTENDPMLGSYGKYIAALTKRCWGATHRWADAVLFAQYEQGLVDGRAVLTGERILRTVAGSGYDAKNRWGLPSVLPLSWSAFQAARASLQRSPDEVISAIRALATPETKEKAEGFIEKAGRDVPALVRVEEALKKKVGT